MAKPILTADEVLKALELDLSDPQTIEAVWKKGRRVPSRSAGT